MKFRAHWTVLIIAAALLAGSAWTYMYRTNNIQAFAALECEELENSPLLLRNNQISAEYLTKVAILNVKCSESGALEVQELLKFKQQLVFDIYIKASSYALINKIFFNLSILFAIAVFIWPSIGVIFKKKLETAEWYRSAIVQTSITGLAALCFTVYSDYKNKQTYAENLIREVISTDVEDKSVLSKKIAEELSKIDNGFVFSTLRNDDS